jgi:hypothetical protein
MSITVTDERDRDGDNSSVVSSRSDKDISSSGASSSGTSGDASSGSRNRSLYGIRRLGISERQERVVGWSRFAFLFSLLVLASALAAGVYFQVHEDELEDFETEVRISLIAGVLSKHE